MFLARDSEPLVLRHCAPLILNYCLSLIIIIFYYYYYFVLPNRILPKPNPVFLKLKLRRFCFKRLSLSFLLFFYLTFLFSFLSFYLFLSLSLIFCVSLPCLQFYYLVLRQMCAC